MTLPVIPRRAPFLRPADESLNSFRFRRVIVFDRWPGNLRTVTLASPESASVRNARCRHALGSRSAARKGSASTLPFRLARDASPWNSEPSTVKC